MGGVVDSGPVIPRLDVGQTARATLSLLRRNLPLAVPLGVLLGVVPALLPSLLPFWPEVMHAPGAGLTSRDWAIRILDVVIGAVTQALLIASLTHAAVADAEGRQAGLADSLGAGFHRILPLFGLTLTEYAGTGLGLLLLVVPGVVVYLKWLVAVPAQVVEGHGIRRALNRSAELVQGNRWRCLALALIFLVLPIVAMTGLLYLSELLGYSDASVTGIIMSACCIGLYATLYGALPGVLFIQLREMKDGPDLQRTASVFG